MQCDEVFVHALGLGVMGHYIFSVEHVTGLLPRLICGALRLLVNIERVAVALKFQRRERVVSYAAAVGDRARISDAPEHVLARGFDADV